MFQNPYKYPTYDLALQGKIITGEICRDNQVQWIHKFRQMDIIKIQRTKLSDIAAKEDGHCQVLATMYMHLRQRFLGKPALARRIFKYWCFENKDKLLKKLPEHSKSLERLTTDLINNYFEDDGQKTFVKAANSFWCNHHKRKSKAKEEGYENVTVFTKNPTIKQYVKTSSTIDHQGTDDFDFMREFNPSYFLASNSKYENLSCPQEISEAIVAEVAKINDKDSFRFLINLKNHEHASHALSLVRFDDSMDCIEFIDANRGVFLIPNQKECLQKFLTAYFSQTIYTPFNFNIVQMENYIDIEGKTLSDQDQSRMVLAQRRQIS